jgi:hypothetical protein
MQKVRYSKGFNSLYIKFQYYFISDQSTTFHPFIHTTIYTIETRFYLALEVDSPVFCHIITFYNLLGITV